MGNQISLTRKRKQLQNKSSSTSLSTRTFPDSINGNGSITSSTPPKFLADLFPGTLIEANRQQGEHYLYKHLFQVSYFAPIDNILSKSGSTALDIACGPHASWVLDVANDFPDCTFYGFDIIEPFSLPNTETNSCHIPDNCKLQQLDILDAGINYPDNTFDFVHQRNINMVYQYDKIQWLIGEVLRVTKDDGWIEFVEPDLCPKRAGPIFTKLSQAAIRYAKQRLGGFFEGNKLTAFMKEAGLVDIKSDYGSLPVCWGGYIGKLVYEDMMTSFNHVGPLLYGYLDIEGEFNQEAYDALLDNACNECVEYQTFFNVRWAYGRKPAKNSTASTTSTTSNPSTTSNTDP